MLINCKVGDGFIYHAGKLLSKHGYFHAEGLKFKCHVVEILDDAQLFWNQIASSKTVII